MKKERKRDREGREEDRGRERRDRYRRPIEVTRLLWFSHYSSGRSILEAHLAAGTISALSLFAASPALTLILRPFLSPSPLPFVPRAYLNASHQGTLCSCVRGITPFLPLRRIRISCSRRPPAPLDFPIGKSKNYISLRRAAAIAL